MKTKYYMKEASYIKENGDCYEEEVVFYEGYRQPQILACNYTPKKDFERIMKKVKDKFYRTRRVN